MFLLYNEEKNLTTRTRKKEKKSLENENAQSVKVENLIPQTENQLCTRA